MYQIPNTWVSLLHWPNQPVITGGGRPATGSIQHNCFIKIFYPMYLNLTKGVVYPHGVQLNKQKQQKRKPVYLFILLLLIWCLAPIGLYQLDPTIGNIDQNIWLLVVLGMISFLLLLALCWWLLQLFWKAMQLPTLKSMVSQFNTLELWQQLSFYWASFAMLLLAASGCLCAVC
jgi:hypothetical protein